MKMEIYLANTSTSSDKFNFDYKIFLTNGNINIEDPDSKFNQLRLAVLDIHRKRFINSNS